jgi:hypothetical protein
MPKRQALLGLILVAAWPQVARGQDSLARARALYAQNKLAEAYPLFASAAKAHPRSAEAHAWLAETARRRGLYDEARDAARTAVAIDSCSTFALTVLGYLYQPIYSGWEGTSADSSWHYYRRAVGCDPGDGNAWVGLWMEALRRGELSWETRSLRSLDTSGFLTPPVLAYNRWVLHTLPPRALLLTAGDWDTYPALALQTVDYVRSDVGIVNLSMLNLPWYVRLVCERYGVRAPFADSMLDRLSAEGHLADSVVRVWRAQSLAGQLERPLAAATTVGPYAVQEGAGTFQDAGPYRLLTADTTAADTSLMRRALADVRGGDFAGPEVSPADRSAIRMAAAVQRPLTTSVLWVGLRYASAMLDAGARAEAGRALDWADAFVKGAGLGQEQREMVQHVRERAARASGDSVPRTRR